MSQERFFVVSLWVFVLFVFQKMGRVRSFDRSPKGHEIHVLGIPSWSRRVSLVNSSTMIACVVDTR